MPFSMIGLKIFKAFDAFFWFFAPVATVRVAIRALPQERFAFCRVLGSGPDCTVSPVCDE